LAAEKAPTAARAELKWRNGASIAGVFEGESGSNGASNAGAGVVCCRR